MASTNTYKPTKSSIKSPSETKTTRPAGKVNKIITIPGRRTGFSPKEFTKTGALHPMSRIRAKRKTITINGQRIQRDSGDPSFLINRGLAILKRRGFAQFPQIVGDELAAETFLFNIGCTVSHEPVEFTLADPTYDPNLDQEEIENPNILDIPSFQKLTNQNILATDKFSFVNDPFFRLDGDEYGGIPTTLLDQRRDLIKSSKVTTGLLEIAAAYASLNTSSKDRSVKLKDFIKITHSI